MKLRVGLVGLGESWEARHRPALNSLRDKFDVRAVCCEVAARADQAAREFDAEPMDGFRALSSRADIDAVLVLSPDWYGPLPLLAACEFGKAIYCAPALDIAQGQATTVRQRVEESGVAFMAEFPRRYAAATIRLKELIATRLGAPRLLFCHARRKGASLPKRRTKPGISRTTRDLMESVDWCRYAVGCDPTSVIGIQHNHSTLSPIPNNAAPNNAEDVDTENANSENANTENGEIKKVRSDYLMMSLDFSQPDCTGRGPLAHISCGSYLPESWSEALAFRPPAELQVCCQNGVAFIDLPSTLIWFDEAGRHHESLDADRPVGEQLLTQFHRAVTSLVRKTVDLEDAYRTLNIVLAARASFAQGERIFL